MTVGRSTLAAKFLPPISTGDLFLLNGLQRELAMTREIGQQFDANR